MSSVKEDVKAEVVIRVPSVQDIRITALRTFKVAKVFGADLYINPRLHARMIIVDDEKALVGSADVTYGGMEENLEFLTYASHIEDVLRTYSEILKSVKLEESASVIVYQKLENGFLKGILLEDMPLESFVKIPTKRGYILCRIVSTYTQEIPLAPKFSKDKLMFSSFRKLIWT